MYVSAVQLLMSLPVIINLLFSSLSYLNPLLPISLLYSKKCIGPEGLLYEKVVDQSMDHLDTKTRVCQPQQSEGLATQTLTKLCHMTV